MVLGKLSKVIASVVPSNRPNFRNFRGHVVIPPEKQRFPKVENSTKLQTGVFDEEITIQRQPDIGNIETGRGRCTSAEKLKIRN